MGIFSESCNLRVCFPLLSIPSSISSYGEVRCCIQKNKMEENKEVLTQVVETRLLAGWGALCVPGVNPCPVPMPSSPCFPLHYRGGLAQLLSCFSPSSPTPKALGTVSCSLSLSLPFISTARALCPSVLSPQSQQEHLSMSSAEAQSAPFIPPSRLPSCSHSLGDELFMLSTCESCFGIRTV